MLGEMKGREGLAALKVNRILLVSLFEVPLLPAVVNRYLQR
jgi:hypothetical protein